MLRNLAPSIPPLAASRFGKTQLYLAYSKAGKQKGEIAIWSSSGRVHSVTLESSPDDPEAPLPAPRSGFARALFGEGSLSGDYVFRVSTDSRTWVFSTSKRGAACLWITVLSIGMQSRASTLMSLIPLTRSGIPFASLTGLPDASTYCEWRAN